jgi:hypothetical protein
MTTTSRLSAGKYADNEAKYYSCIDRLAESVIEKCGEL